METNIEQLLTDYKNKQEATWVMAVMNLNMDLFEQLQTQKAKSTLKRMTAGKIITIILGIIWVIFLALCVYAGLYARNPYFVISIGAILLINIITVIMYIQQVVLIRRINYSSSITVAQQKLSKLQLSTLTMTRILFLQMPFWTTFFWHPGWISFSDWHFWLISFPVSLVFTAASVWMFRNIRIGNKDKKWFGYLFHGQAWKPIIEAQAFLNDIEEFKKV